MTNPIPLKPSYVFVLPWELDLAGGVNQVVANLHREMLAAGEMQPLIMVNSWSALRPAERVIDGRRTVYVRLWSPWSEQRPVAGLLKWVLASPVYLTALRRFFRRHNVVAFNFHYASLAAFPIALLRLFHLYQGELILSFHGADLTTARKGGRIERALWGFVLDNTTAIVACSRALAADVREFAGARGGRVRAVLNGLDIDRFVSSIDRASGLPPGLRDREFILSVATLEQKKGLDVLLRAFADVRRANPGLALALLGRSHGAEADLRALANELNVSDDVFFCNKVPHPQVGLFLERARAFCLPSRSEPFGIAILEAGAYRLPVVASRVGGIPEIIVDGETGLLVEAGDSEALACALNRVLRDRDLARNLGARLYDSVRSNLSWRRAYQEYRTLVPRL